MSAPVGDRDLTLLPTDVQNAARVLENGEVMWPLAETAHAIEALAAAGRVVLGLDVRDYGPDGTFIEIAWSSFEPDRIDDISHGRNAALDALRRDIPIPGDWVLVTWR